MSPHDRGWRKSRQIKKEITFKKIVISVAFVLLSVMFLADLWAAIITG